MTCTQISEKLLLPPMQVTETLSKYGILPVTGPSIDNNTQNAFRRSDITQELIDEINGPNDSFAIAWMSGTSIYPTDASALLGIRLRDLCILRQDLIAPTRPLRLQGNPAFSLKELAIISVQLKDYVSLEQVSKISGLSQARIYQMFFKKKWCSSIIHINSAPHIPKDLADKIVAFPDKYLTCREADVLLGAPSGHTRNLIKLHKLNEIEPPPYYHSNLALVSKEEIEKMRATY